MALKKQLPCMVSDQTHEDVSIYAEDLDLKAGELTRKIVEEWLLQQGPIDPERRRSHRERIARRSKVLDRMGNSVRRKRVVVLRTISTPSGRARSTKPGSLLRRAG